MQLCDVLSSLDAFVYRPNTNGVSVVAVFW